MPNRMKPSRMEKRLTETICRASTQLVADCADAELAAYWARVGRFTEAREKIKLLRQKNECNPKVELSVWLHFSEGLLAYFSNDGVTNADGVQRAHALSVASGMREMRALSAAWLAQWDYAKVDVKSLTFRVQEALQNAGPENHSCRARAALVVAQVLHLATRLDLAKKWYFVAKEHAIAGLDGATIGALMHNMAWQRMLVFRQVVLTNGTDINAGRHALMSAESTAHFEEMTGDASWRNLRPILRAQILSLGGDAEGALTIYGESLSLEKIPERWQANLLSDKAWCHAKLLQFDEAKSCAHFAAISLTKDTQIDDTAATHSRLSQTYCLLNKPDLAEQHRQLAQTLWNQFSEVLSEAVRLLSKIDEDGMVVVSESPS